jgi:hypothetical protein
MTTTSDTLVQTYTWRARGFTEDVTVCGFCGRDELKGTVRMIALDADGDEGDEVYAGVVCAAKRAGRKAAEIRHEATAWDKEQRAAHNRWVEAESSEFCRLRDLALDAAGLTGRARNFAAICAVSETEEFRAGMAAWRAANPAPVTR